VNDLTDLAALVAASRILVIDDNQAIHQDFRKIFGANREPSAPSEAELALFGGGAGFSGVPEFQIDSAYQGQEGLALVRLALEQQYPYALAFVDVRMPPGWDGIETAAQIWQHDPDIQIVICTAYSDYSWSEMLAKLGRSDRLVILKKPFDTIEVVQLASALTEKWRLARQSRAILEDLEGRVAERTGELSQSVEELRRSESLKGAMLQASLDCIVTIDHEGKIVEFNPAAQATFGLTPEQALGKTMVDLIVPPRLRDAHRRGFAHYLATGKGPILGKRLELEAMRADGGEFPIELTITPIGATSKPMFTGFIRDITARKEADEKIKRLNRVYAVLSGINALIVRVGDRNELFREACRIAVEQGSFELAWIGSFDPATLDVNPVAWAGLGAEEYLRKVKSTGRDDQGQGAYGRAMREQRPAFNNDMSVDTGIGGARREEALRRGYRSLMVLPLIVGGAVAGNLSLFAKEPNFFDDEEVRLLANLASNISFALEHIGEAEKLDRMTRVNAMLSGINGAIVRIRDRQELFQEACRIAVETGGLRFALLCVVDEAGRRLRPVASAGDAADDFLEKVRGRLTLRDDAPEGHGISAKSVRERRACVANEVETDADITHKKFVADRGIKSAASLPLFVADRAVGAFTLHAAEVGFFDDDEMKLLNEVAGNIAFALEHIEKEEKVQRLTRVYAVLSGINALIVRARDRDELFDGACRIAVDAGRLRMAWIGIVDRSEMMVVPVASAGADPEFMALAKDRFTLREDTPLGNTLTARAIRSKTIVVSNDVKNDSAVAFGKRHVERGTRSLAVLPLLVSGEAVAILALYAQEVGFFNDEELKLLTELAGDIAFALEHIEKAEKLARTTRVNAMRSGINEAIVRTHDRQGLFEEACRIAVQSGRFPLAWVAAADRRDKLMKAVAWAGDERGFVQFTRPTVYAKEQGKAGLAAQAIENLRPALCNDIAADGRAMRYPKEALERGYRSAVALPLAVDGTGIGALVLYAAEPGFFDAEEVKLLVDLADNVSFALEHVERQEKIAKLSRIRAVSSEINAAIVRIGETKVLLEETCRIVSEHGKFEMIWIGAIDDERQLVQPIAWQGFSEETARAVNWASISTAKGSIGEAIQTRRLSVRNDIAGELPGGRLRAEALKAGRRSSICLPLLVDGKVTALVVLFAAGRGFFDEEELRLLTGLAGDISFGLQNISRQHKLDKLARIRAVSSEINATIIRVHEREALLRETCRIAVEHGKFELVWIALIDREKERIQPVAWAGFSSEIAHGLTWAYLDAQKGTLAEVIRTRKVAVRNDIDAEISTGILRREAVKQGYRSTVSVPFMVDDNVVAAMVLFAAGRGFFDAEELALLNEVAADVSFALQAIDKQAQLDYLAYYDALTGLANRSLFLERVAQYIRSAASRGHKLALYLVDLERFKNINDSLGQAAGDALLRQVAEWLTRKVGDANLLARVGADHFAVVLPEVKPQGNVARLIEKAIGAFLEHPFHLNDSVFRIACKVGIAVFPDNGANADTLFKNAEAALKKAKARGDRYLFYTQQMTETVAGQVTLENQLRQALDNEEFVLHYQPKVSLASGKLTSAEALIRWNDPRTGLVPPGKFIPVLEETGLIYDVGRWALRKAIEDYLRWRDAGLPAVRIAVNVSPLQLRSRGFVAEIQQAIGIDARAEAGLELEITESLIMEDVKHNIASLQAIRAMGVIIAIDDFGTGFSSLAYLSKLPVDTLKIDRSFVIDMTAGPEGLALVSTIITLAHSLRLKAVAEGVETEEQSRLLRLLKCDEMQGYLFSKPVPREIFETKFLAQPSPVGVGLIKG
jgi:diguanylate cyclase (GGDEF)-like protein/PAS domain S-box-containing protein